MLGPMVFALGILALPFGLGFLVGEWRQRGKQTDHLAFLKDQLDNANSRVGQLQNVLTHIQVVKNGMTQQPVPATGPDGKPLQ